MNSQSENIFGIGETVSPREMQDYHAGKLSKSEMNRIERIAASNPMIADALEGTALMAHPETLVEVQSAVKKRAGGGSQLALKIGIALAVAVGIGYVGLKQQQMKSTPTAETSLPAIADVDEDSDALEDKTISVIAHRGTDSSVSITVSKPSGGRQMAEIPEKFVTYTVVPEPLSAADLTEIEDNPSEENHTPKIPNDERIYHVQDYKLVDYRGQREEPFSLLDRSLTGIPAEFDSADEQKARMERPLVTQVPYVDYLEDAMMLFAQGAYREAHAEFQTILKSYPNDANALFYGGITQFRRNKYRKARHHLQASLELPIRTFEQESAFYLAQCLIKTGDDDEAKAILTGIIVADGFYAQQAQKMLDDL